jgi:hypothetical protein
MSDFRPGAPLYWSELEVVSRRVSLPPRRVQELLFDVTVFPAGATFDIDGLEAWRLDSAFFPDEWSGESACAKARLLRRERHLERTCRIELEIGAWTTQLCELRVRPAAHHIERWTGRRQRRYFALAHLCADDIVRRIGAAARDRARRQSLVVREPFLVLVGGRA